MATCKEKYIWRTRFVFTSIQSCHIFTDFLGFLSPRPRYGHRVVAVRGLILLFGGGDSGIIDDLLVYSTENGNWFQPSTNGQVREIISVDPE